jgi:hypothetical protein
LSATLIAGLFLTSPISLLAPQAQAATTVYLSETDKLQFLKANASYALSATKTAAGAFASTKPAVKGTSAAALASNRRAEVGVF